MLAASLLVLAGLCNACPFVFMSNAENFYPKLHAADATYSAGEYRLESLLCLRSLKEWGVSHSAQQLHVLDVGCGKGLFLRNFVQEIRTRWQISQVAATGIDIARSQNDLFSEISTDFKFIQQDLDDHTLPLPEKSMDFICCNHVLEHIFATEKLVREFRRVVKPDGLCVISVPNLSAWMNRVFFLFAGQPLGSELGTESVTYGFWPTSLQGRLRKFNPSGHIRDFTPRGLRDLTAHCGFETVGWWPQSHGFIARLGKWAGRGIGIVLKPASSSRV
jgi:SAM-dependent methyltransferase